MNTYNNKMLYKSEHTPNVPLLLLGSESYESYFFYSVTMRDLLAKPV